MASKKKKDKTRQQKFCEFVALGYAPYKAAIEAGYTESYAKNFSYKLWEKYGNKIEELKSLAEETIKEEFKYTTKESFDKLNEIQELALKVDVKGTYANLSAAIKAEELKGKLYGAYAEDNAQKSQPVTLNFNRKYD